MTIYFVETYNQNNIRDAGLDMVFVQDNQSMSTRSALHGMHFQCGADTELLEATEL